MCVSNHAQICNKPMRISWKELALHNTPSSAFVAIRGKVYDLTTFINRHPGGRDVLYLSIGRDVTQVFESYHDVSAVEAVLRKYEVGELTDSELPTFPPSSSFEKDLKQRVKTYFQETGYDPKFHPLHAVHYLMVVMLFIAAYYAQFFVPLVRDNAWLSGIAAAVLGFMSAETCFSFVHDASHMAFSHRPAVWTALGAWHDFMNGASSVAWFYQHVLGHHPYTNVSSADPDIHVSEAHFRRISSDQRWHPVYLLQHVYAPILYSFYGLKSRYDDIAILYFTKYRGAIRVNPLQLHQHVIFWAGKAFFAFYRIILPAFFVPFWKVMWLFAIAELCTAWTLALVFQANHVVGTALWPKPDPATNKVDMDWMKLQIATAQDYSWGSFWATKLTGALNLQTTHHCFPNICQIYYPEIADQVKAVCKEHNVQYNIRKDFWEAIGDHIRLLWDFGRNSDQPHAKQQ